MEEILRVENLRKTFAFIQKAAAAGEDERKNRRSGGRNLLFRLQGRSVWAFRAKRRAAKPQLLRMLATLIRPDEGDAFIEGISVRQDPAGVRERIGFLTSELRLEEFFTPNYLFDFFSELHNVDPETRDRRKKELFSKFGVDEFAEVKVADLSTGMKQKVSLVISIVHDPDIIIFDEPTNGLDVLTARVVTDFLLESEERREKYPCIHPYLQPGGKNLRSDRYYHKRKNGTV